MADSPVAYAKANLAEARKCRDELKTIDHAATIERRGFTADEQGRIDELRSQIEAAESRSSAFLDQADPTAPHPLLGLLPDTGGGPVETRSIGNLPPVAFSSDSIHELHEAYESRSLHTVTADVELRAVTAVPMATISDYQRDPRPFLREPTRVAALMPTQLVEQPNVTFYVGTTAASAAATVAEGAAKPASSPAWTPTTLAVRKIAHYVDVSTEALSDYPNFESVVRTEMVAGLILAENAQVLSGSGSGTNMTGLTQTSGIQTYAPGSAEARLLSILHGITMLRTGTSFTEPDTIFLNPTDWEVVLKYAATTGELIVSPNPGSGPTMELWGIRVVATSQLAAGTGLVANLVLGTVVFSREPASIKVDPYSQSDHNLVRFIAEERLVLGVTRPSAITAVTFNGTV